MEAEDDLRMLSRADEIRRNRKRLMAARRIAKKQLTGLKRIAGGGRRGKR